MKTVVKEVMFQNQDDKPKHLMDIEAGPIALILEAYGAPPQIAASAANAIIEHLIVLSLGAGASSVQ
jgi:hypothetical protein